MIKQYLQQAFYQLKENKLISGISIVGTALAICMIMVITIIFQIKNADYKPEVNRSRTLYVQFGESYTKDKHENVSMNNTLSLPYYKDAIATLTGVEAVTAMTTSYNPLSIIGSADRVAGSIKHVDMGFWKIFDFDFLSGHPFTESDFQSGMKQAVLREEAARKLFHTTDVVGKEFQIRGVTYTVCGVIRDFSKWANKAYADAYVPYTSKAGEWWAGNGQTSGPFSALILTKGADSFDEVSRQINVNTERFNQNQSEYVVGIREQPYTHFQQLFFTWDLEKPHVAENVLRYTVILLLLLLVPAINLSGIMLSRMQKRMEEIGVRRAFGATRWQIVGQILNENLVMTLLGGILGMVFSYIAIFVMGDWLLNGDKSISLQMVASPIVFVLAFLFCLALNLLSAGIPAWRVASKNITDAIK